MKAKLFTGPVIGFRPTALPIGPTPGDVTKPFGSSILIGCNINNTRFSFIDSAIYESWKPADASRPVAKIEPRQVVQPPCLDESSTPVYLRRFISVSLRPFLFLVLNHFVGNKGAPILRMAAHRQYTDLIDNACVGLESFFSEYFFRVNKSIGGFAKTSGTISRCSMFMMVSHLLKRMGSYHKRQSSNPPTPLPT